MRNRTLIFSLCGAGVLLAGAALTWWAGLPGETAEDKPPAGPLVNTVRAELDNQAPFVVQTGFIRASNPLPVSAEINGRIDSIGESFAIGRQVPAGEVLVRLKTDRLTANLSQAQAELEQARVELSLFSRQLKRQRKLVDQSFISAAKLDEIETQRAQAIANEQVAKASLETARITLEDAAILAPFDAIVTDASATRGALVQSGQILGQLAGSSQAEIIVGLSAAQYSRVGGLALLGEAVTIVPENRPEQQVKGLVDAISPEMNERSRTIDIKVLIENPFSGETPLVLNSLARVKLPARELEGRLFLLPLQALQAGRSLWAVRSDSTLEPIDATIIDQSDNNVWVVSKTLTTDARLLSTPVPNPIPGLPVRVSNRPEAMAQQ